MLACGYVALSLLLSGFYMRTGELRIRPLVWLSYASYPRRAARRARLRVSHAFPRAGSADAAYSEPGFLPARRAMPAGVPRGCTARRAAPAAPAED